jgi:ABC-type nitrate/sulfonate/bicarbonate transport system substrate-binding protein
MASIDTNYLDDLIKRFKGFKSPTDTQKLIVLLGEKDFRTADDQRKLAVLLKAEKKADQLAKARADARRLIDAEKAKARKTETRRKIIWLSAIEKMCEDNPQELQTLNRLKSLAYQNGYVNERDKNFLKETKDSNASN